MADWMGVCRHCGAQLGRSAALQNGRGVFRWSYFRVSNGQKKCIKPDTYGLEYMLHADGEVLYHSPVMPDLSKSQEVEQWLTTDS